MNSVQRIAYGAGTMWFKSTPGDINRELVDAIKTALDVGYRHIDNAQIYRNEAECGVALQETKVARSDIYITTKYWPSAEKNPYDALKESLKLLKSDSVDLYLIHNPWFDKVKGHEQLESLWADMERCHKDGLTRHIGVSNFAVADLERIKAVAKTLVYANQIEYHPYFGQPDLIAYMQQHGIIGESYAGLAPIRYKPDGPLSPVVQKLAKKYSRTEGQVLLRWSLQKGNVVVTTSGKESRMKEQLAITDFTLEDNDVQELDRVGSQLHFRKYEPLNQ